MLPGSKVGADHGKGRIQIRLDGKWYESNRLAWFYIHGVWPVGLLDHADVDPGNDRFKNLRKATRSQNSANRGAQRNNKVGIKGVHKLPSGRYCSNIRVNGQRIYLGVSDTKEQAGEVCYLEALLQFGEFAR